MNRFMEVVESVEDVFSGNGVRIEVYSSEKEGGRSLVRIRGKSIGTDVFYNPVIDSVDGRVEGIATKEPELIKELEKRLFLTSFVYRFWDRF